MVRALCRQADDRRGRVGARRAACTTPSPRPRRLRVRPVDYAAYRPWRRVAVALSRARWRPPAGGRATDRAPGPRCWPGRQARLSPVLVPVPTASAIDRAARHSLRPAERQAARHCNLRVCHEEHRGVPAVRCPFRHDRNRRQIARRPWWQRVRELHKRPRQGRRGSESCRTSSLRRDRNIAARRDRAIFQRPALFRRQ